MKISVLIIAHNEEKLIEKCIKSILNQTQEPNEVILIAHNCTDGTVEISQKYSQVNTIIYNNTPGGIFALIKGLEMVTGDIVCCIDGDAWADKNWVEEMVKTLDQNNILVGSWIKFKGTFLGWISNFFNKYLCIENKKPERWFWGASMTFWGKDKNLINDILEKSIVLSKNLELTRNPYDYWLGLFMKDYGNIKITNDTCVTAQTKEISTKETFRRNTENRNNGKKIDEYLKRKNLNS